MCLLLSFHLVSHKLLVDKKTRDKAVKHLALFLSNPENNALPEIEIAKLWKGLFYCRSSFSFITSCLTYLSGFWMSDKRRVQQDLAQELAEILLTITSISSSLSFLRGFWITTVREWNGIDRLRYVLHAFPTLFAAESSPRMDKYYMLVRRFLNASFRLLIRAKWDPSALQEYTSILTNTGGPLWSVLFPEPFSQLIEILPQLCRCTRTNWPYLPSSRSIPRGTGKGPVRFRLTCPCPYPRTLVPVHILRCTYTDKHDV